MALHGGRTRGCGRGTIVCCAGAVELAGAFIEGGRKLASLPRSLRPRAGHHLFEVRRFRGALGGLDSQGLCVQGPAVRRGDSHAGGEDRGRCRRCGIVIRRREWVRAGHSFAVEGL
jgi:hypothetical protein